MRLIYWYDTGILIVLILFRVVWYPKKWYGIALLISLSLSQFDFFARRRHFCGDFDPADQVPLHRLIKIDRLATSR